jgi:hypothetical protein
MEPHTRHAPTRPLLGRPLLDRPLLCAAVGAVLGVAISALLGAVGQLGPGPRGAAAVPLPDVAPAFLAAWRLHLTTSWWVDESVERTEPNGSAVRFTILEAQRPPDSIEIGGTTISARQGATAIACAAGPSSGYACRRAPAEGTWIDQVAAAMAALRRVLTGPAPVYRVVVGGPGCYQWVLRIPVADLPVSLPRAAQYCIDPVTGIVRSSRVDLSGVVDTVTVVAQHAPATAADVALPADAAF